jgi:AhpD family alkylhydroperoxidase
MGHLAAMAQASKVDVDLVWDDLPLLPGVLQCLAEGIASGAVERNRESSGHCLAADENVEPAMLDLCFDPQTSGGLLIAVAESSAQKLLDRLHAAGIAEAVAIGKIVDAGTGRVFLVSVSGKGVRNLLCKAPEGPFQQKVPDTFYDPTQETNKMACCESNHEPAQPAAAMSGEAAGIQQKFHEFLQAAGSPGALDAKTKKAIAIALSVMARCEPCVKSHVAKAREMGFSQEEIDEAAWLAIAFGGSPTMVFYNGVRKA